MFLPEQLQPKGADAEVGAWQSIGLAVGNNIPPVVAEMRRAIRNTLQHFTALPFYLHLIFWDSCYAAIFLIYGGIPT